MKTSIESLVARNMIPDVSKKKRTTLAESTDSDSTTKFDHSEWDEVLKAYVVSGCTINDVEDVNTVDYDGIAADSRFASYLQSLAGADVKSLPVAEKLALWMNAYNAICISLIIEQEKIRGSPLKSINEISGKVKM